MMDRDRLAGLVGLFKWKANACIAEQKSWMSVDQWNQLSAMAAAYTFCADAILPTERDYDAETVVVLTIRPSLDEPRWKALHAAAVEAGAVHAHINPPGLLTAA